MGFLLVMHVILCILLIGMVLLQVGKGASTGPSFGGGGRTLFGPTGRATFLGKVIVVLAILFALSTLTLAILLGGGKPPA